MTNDSEKEYPEVITDLLHKHDLCKNGYSDDPDSAIVYTFQALKCADELYGFGSRKYVEIFTDYAIPDCSDQKNMLTYFIYPVVTARFCPDSIYVGNAYFELARALSMQNEYNRADYLFTLARERAACIEDSLTVEIERAINWQKMGNGIGIMYSVLNPLITQAESAPSPFKEECLFRIYHLLGKYYKRLYMDGYPDSAMGFMEKAKEYYEFAPISDKILFLQDEYRLLLEQDHRKAIACIDQMLDLFGQDTEDLDLNNWHAMANIIRGDYCSNELLDDLAAIKYYMAANDLLSAPIHNDLKIKWTLLHRMTTVLSRAGMFEEACHCGEVLVALSAEHAVNEQSMFYALSLAETYISADKFDKAEQLLNYYALPFQNYSSLSDKYQFIRGQLYIHNNEYAMAADIYRDLVSNGNNPSSKLRSLISLLDAATNIDNYNHSAIADSINEIIISGTSSQILRISPHARSNWQSLCDVTLADEIRAQQNGCDIATQILRLSLFKKGLIFRTSKEIDAVISDNRSLAPQKERLVNLRDSLNYYSSIGNKDLTSDYRNKIENLEWSLAYDVTHSPEFYSKLNPSMERIVNRMRPDDICIEFIATEREKDTCYFAILFGKTLDPTFIPLYDVNSDNDTISFSTIIWPKIEPYLRDKKRVYFCADGKLSNIGIEYLTSESGELMSHKYEIHRVFHLSDIAEYDLIGDKIVAIGVSDHNSPIGQGDTLNRGGMTDLPNVAYEIELIKDRIGLNRLDVLFNDDATEKNVKKLSGSNVTTLHISTHGVYRSIDNISSAVADPECDDYYIAKRMLSADIESLSGLILRQGNLSWKSSDITQDEDDILTAEEIENLSLPDLRLTVLSACDTGLGEIDSDGVWGLQRAFRIAGSKSLICSLTKVDDYWTAQFMDVFYENAANGNTIYESFHKAQKWLYDEQPDRPEVWSSFILIE